MLSNQADQQCLSGLTVLYVGDEPWAPNLISTFLKPRVGRLCVAADGAGGLDLFRRERPDLLVCDLIGPGSQSLELIEAIRAEVPNLPIILSLGRDQTDVFSRCLELGVNRLLQKPLRAVHLEAAALHCAHELSVPREQAALHKQKLALLQAQHVEAIGVLAGGIAHDYNNLLQAVMINIAMAKRSRSDPDQVFLLLDAAESAWEEIRELGNRLGLLQPRESSYQYINNLEVHLREALDKLVGASGCNLEVVLPEGLPGVSFNRRQMKEAMGILASNAVEAMGGSGTLRIEGKTRRIRPEEPVPVAPGDYLELSFSDDGPGIAPEILPLMFSPYTSTKARGRQRGMGLSLALAQAIVKQHAGALLGENRAGGGATLHLLLPVPSSEEGCAMGRPDLGRPGSVLAS